MTKREAIAQNKALRELLANVDALIGESLAEWTKTWTTIRKTIPKKGRTQWL